MEQLEKLRQRIGTAGELLSVVRTMKGLAAVSIRAFETASHAVGQYAETVELGLQVLSSQGAETVFSRAGSVGLKRREVTGILVFGSEHGLCGSFNRLVAGFAADEIREAETVRIAVAGSRVADVLDADHGRSIDRRLAMPASVEAIVDSVADALELANRWLEEDGVTRIRLLRNRIDRGATYTPVTTTLFPFDPEWIRELRERPWRSEANCLPVTFAPTPHLLKWLVRHHLFAGLYRAFAESLAAEQAARLAAMQAAEKNIEERLQALERDFHQLRQAMITEELLDIVSGFEVMQSRRGRRHGHGGGGSGKLN